MTTQCPPAVREWIETVFFDNVIAECAKPRQMLTIPYAKFNGLCNENALAVHTISVVLGIAGLKAGDVTIPGYPPNDGTPIG